MDRVDNEIIERALKLLDSGYHNRGSVSKILGISLVDVDRIRSGLLRARIDISAYDRCPGCGYLVRMPCVFCLSKSEPTVLVLAPNRGTYAEWMYRNDLIYTSYRYIGGVYNLLSFNCGSRMIRMPGWCDNDYYDDCFMEKLLVMRCVDVTNTYRETFSE